MNRRLTKAFIGALSFAAALSTAVVCNASDAQAKKASVKKVTASAPSGKKVYVAKGKKVKITTIVKVKPNKKANKKVTYKSANKKIATVSAKGVVKGVKAGKTKITITSKKNKKKKTVLKFYVKKAAVKKLKIKRFPHCQLTINIIPIIVAESTDTNAPAIIAGKPKRVISSLFSGANTPIPPSKIPIDEILAKPHKI